MASTLSTFFILVSYLCGACLGPNVWLCSSSLPQAPPSRPGPAFLFRPLPLLTQAPPYPGPCLPTTDTNGTLSPADPFKVLSTVFLWAPRVQALVSSLAKVLVV